MALKFVLLPGKLESPGSSQLYQSAYETFHTVWESTFKSIVGQEYVQYSNDFTRQKYVQALFEGNKCVGLDLIRPVDLLNPVDLKDSWLKSWSPQVLQFLAQKGNPCLINSFFTVHPDYRKSLFQNDLHASYILGCLSVLHQLELGVPTMLGMMRNSRSMNELAQSLGASTLETILHNGEETDLVVFHEQSIKRASKTFPKLVFNLLKTKSDYTEEQSDERHEDIA